MIKSMTGFGRSEYSDGKRNINVEIRAVNHRYSDISVRIPRRYSFAEEKIKSIVKDVARRGKIEVSVIIENITEDDTTIKLNMIAAKEYIDNLVELKDNFAVPGEITLQFLATLPDVMKVVPNVGDEEEFMKTLETSVKQASDKLDEMRCVEGGKLFDDITMRGDLIQGMLREIEERAPQVSLLYTQKMKDRINELLNGSLPIPEERILLEAAIFADKSNITEEIVRLKSHIAQLKNIISNSTQPDGKKLDFLVQEMNREANTIGSKANDLGITSKVLEIKSEIEKIKEQVQNIE